MEELKNVIAALVSDHDADPKIIADAIILECEDEYRERLKYAIGDDELELRPDKFMGKDIQATDYSAIDRNILRAAQRNRWQERSV